MRKMRIRYANTANGADFSCGGFSFIEIMVVVGIISVLGVTVLTSLWTRRSRVELDNATRQVAALLREAQSRSVAQEDNSVWGVHFDNQTSTTPFYALFKGSSYSASKVLSRGSLPSRVQYNTSTVSSGGTLDITFSRVSGAPSTSTSITLELTTGGGGGSAEGASRSASGLIFFDDFNRTNL